jgi:hypothetical protein
VSDAGVFDGEHHLMMCAAAAGAGWWWTPGLVGAVAVPVARSEVARLPADLGEALAELIATRGQVRRVGVLLNQLAAHANAMGRCRRWPGWPMVVRRLDQLTEQAGWRRR